MNRLIKIYVAALLTNFTKIAGLPLNETTGHLNHKIIGTDEATNAFQEVRPKKQELSDGLKKDAKATSLTSESYMDQTNSLFLSTAQLTGHKDVLLTVQIDYIVNPAPELKHERKLQADEKQSEPTPGDSRRLLSPGYCTNPTTMLNLLNTAALAEQSSFKATYSPTAVTGCNGDMIEINTANPPPNYNWVFTKLTMTDAIFPSFWKVTFSVLTYIKSALFINRDDCAACDPWFATYIATFGNFADVTQNDICVPQGKISTGGWYLCPTLMSGYTFGVYSTSQVVNFMEVMAYSQEAIQMNAISASFIGTNSGQPPVSNAIQNIVALLADSSQAKCVTVLQPSSGLATFSSKFKAQVLINGVTLIPGYRNVKSKWVSNQMNVNISVKTVGGTKTQCGNLANYYVKYSEAKCNIQANEIIVEQKSANDLRFCGFGALADCNCAQTSFAPNLFTTKPALIASPASLSITSTDSVQTILIAQVPDTVSSVCGSADGVSKCGPRQISFKDKLTGLQIVTWPYKGYNFYTATAILTLDPALSDATSVMTVTVSLMNYPLVQISQDITVNVSGATVNCDCSQSSFQTIPQTPIASPASLSISPTDSVQTILIAQMPDTVSKVCGSLDGFTQCGTRLLTFMDKLTGLPISTWPYRGYNFATSSLTLDPAVADAMSVLTVTVSLTNYPLVEMSQDISVTVVNCDCTQSSLQTIPQTPIASPTSLSITSRDSIQIIQIAQIPDTVSSACGSADGFTQCGPRSLSFKDKLTGLTISTWLYKGYNFDSTTEILTLDPAIADAMSVLTVTVILTNYPSVQTSQDITVTVLAVVVNCVCELSSFSQLPTPLASPTFLYITSKDSIQYIQISNLTDTVSSNCGLADGFTQCGLAHCHLWTDKVFKFLHGHSRDTILIQLLLF